MHVVLKYFYHKNLSILKERRPPNSVTCGDEFSWPAPFATEPRLDFLPFVRQPFRHIHGHESTLRFVSPIALLQANTSRLQYVWRYSPDNSSDTPTPRPLTFCCVYRCGACRFGPRVIEQFLKTPLRPLPRHSHVLIRWRQSQRLQFRRIQWALRLRFPEIRAQRFRPFCADFGG